jgi:CheY-like chemotaxis protein
MTVTTVLYVDDEPDLREVAVMSLEIDPELSVRAAGSGREALQILDEGYRPDVMLFDVMMPHMDGPALLAACRARPETANTPVIFITARAQSRELEAFLALGACGVIVKPFDPMTLALELRAILARSCT